MFISNGPAEWDYSVFHRRNQPLLHRLLFVDSTKCRRSQIFTSFRLKKGFTFQNKLHLHPSSKVRGWNPSSSRKSWKICIQNDTMASDSLHMGLCSRWNWKWKHRCCRNTLGESQFNKESKNCQDVAKELRLLLWRKRHLLTASLSASSLFSWEPDCHISYVSGMKWLAVIHWLKQRREVFFLFKIHNLLHEVLFDEAL